MQVSGVADRGVSRCRPALGKETGRSSISWAGRRPHLGEIRRFTSTVRCLLGGQMGLNETAGGGRWALAPLPNSWPPFLISALHYDRPCPPAQTGGLTKVVNGQPEHVIGAHPSIINVLQDETLMETYDLVFICLQKQKKKKRSSLVFGWIGIKGKPFLGVLTFSCPTTILKMQLSGVGWWSCAVILCAIFVKGRLCDAKQQKEHSSLSRKSKLFNKFHEHFWRKKVKVFFLNKFNKSSFSTLNSFQKAFKKCKEGVKPKNTHSEFFDNCYFSLVWFSFPCKAWRINLSRDKEKNQTSARLKGLTLRTATQETWAPGMNLQEVSSCEVENKNKQIKSFWNVWNTAGFRCLVFSKYQIFPGPSG